MISYDEATCLETVLSLASLAKEVVEDVRASIVVWKVISRGSVLSRASLVRVAEAVPATIAVTRAM